MQKLIRIFKTDDVTQEDYRFFLILNFSAILGFTLHLGFIFLFYWLDVKSVAWLNIGSCTIYLIMYFINRKGLHDLASAFALAEIVMHAILVVIAIGWDSGFQYYILAVLPFIYLNTLWPGVSKFSIMAILYIAFVGLLFSTRGQTPIALIQPGILDIINGVNIGVFFIIFSWLAYYYSSITQKVENRLTQANEKLETLAARDDLTGLLNRREMRRMLEIEIGRCRSEVNTFVVILGDIDDFKHINDNFGHYAGDQVLMTLSSVMRKTLRKDDKLARWGGEEFLLLLPETDLVSARLVAEKLREHIAQANFNWENRPIMVTMTFGVSIFTRDCNFDEVMRRADDALIQGKAVGKNCVVISPVPA